ncbi:MAG: class I SAM-dependent methyltransferase [Sulfuricaulis sp.]
MKADTINPRHLGQADIGFQKNLYRDPNPTRHWLHNARREWVMSHIDRYTPTGNEKVLEIGVGCGVFTRHISARGCRIFAVDINSRFLDAVRDLPGVIVSHHDATENLMLNGFNVALCSEVIEHVPRDRSLRLLMGIFGSLKPGGVLILSTPQAYSTMELAARCLRLKPVLSLARWIYGTVDELGHINLLTRCGLKRQITMAGFHVIEETAIGLYVPLLAEVGGVTGRRVAKFLERILWRIPLLSGLLWTQCYVLKKPT